MRYRHLYDAIQDEAVFARLVTVGWFPFLEIITAEFRDLLRQCEAGFDLSEIESQIISKFDESRMQNIRERWIAEPHFAA
jgi:hypothetical protein